MATPIRPVSFSESGRSLTAPSLSSTGLVSMSVISGLTDVANSFISAQRMRNTAKFNMSMADLQGRMTKLSADAQIKQIREKAQGLYSTQRALYAKAGVRMEGSPAEVMADSLKNSEIDAIYTGINAEYQTSLQRTQAKISNMEARSAMLDTIPKVGKTLLNMGTQYFVNQNANANNLYLAYAMKGLY